MNAERGASPLPALLLTGPTAAGKTALAVELARRLPFDLVSADSMQVYRGMEIGTGQPTREELAGMPIRLCGERDPRESFDAKTFVDACDAARAEIARGGRTPLFVGGTGMYLRALRFGLFEEPDARPDAGETRGEARARLEAEIARSGPEALHARLTALDARTAAAIAPRDAVRIVRALEIVERTGAPLAPLRSQWEAPVARFPHVLVVLTRPRASLAERIARRAEAMWRAGWADEVRALLAAGIAPDSHAFKAIGYREIAEHLAGRASESETLERVKTATRRFAKRQLVWFRKEPGATWIDLDETGEEEAIARIEKSLERPGALA